MSKPTAQLERERGMYGCEIDPFVQSVEESLAFQISGPGMVIMSLLSDAQEELALDMKERARQTINRAKFLVQKYLPSKVHVGGVSNDV